MSRRYSDENMKTASSSSYWWWCLVCLVAAVAGFIKPPVIVRTPQPAPPPATSAPTDVPTSAPMIYHQVLPDSLYRFVNTSQSFSVSPGAHIFLYRQKMVALGVMVPDTADACSCLLQSTISLKLPNGTVLGQCGGAHPFLNVPSRIVNCGDTLFCSPLAHLPPGDGGDYTGWLFVDIAMAPGSFCTYLSSVSLDVYTDCGNGPLCNLTSIDVLTLTPPAGHYTADKLWQVLAGENRSGSAYSVPVLKADLSSPADRRDVFFFPVDAIANMSSEALWHQGCALDAVHSCRFENPANANFVTVRIAQIQGTTASITFIGLSPDAASPIQITCGGSVADLAQFFQDDPPQDDLCTVFQTCYEGMVDPSPFVILVTPSSELRDACTSTTTILVDFSIHSPPARNATTSTLAGQSDCAFRCDSNATCLSWDRVCDGIVDCLSGADEPSTCWGWARVSACPMDGLVNGTLFSMRETASFEICRKFYSVLLMEVPAQAALSVFFNGSHCFFSLGNGDDTFTLVVNNETVAAINGPNNCSNSTAGSASSVPLTLSTALDFVLISDVVLGSLASTFIPATELGSGFDCATSEPFVTHPSLSLPARPTSHRFAFTTVCTVSAALTPQVESDLQTRFAGASTTSLSNNNKTNLVFGSFASYPFYQTLCSMVDASEPCDVPSTYRSSIRRLKVVVQSRSQFGIGSASPLPPTFSLTWSTARTPQHPTEEKKTVNCFGGSYPSFGANRNYSWGSSTGADGCDSNRGTARTELLCQICVVEFSAPADISQVAIRMQMDIGTKSLTYYAVSVVKSFPLTNVNGTSRIENTFSSHAAINFILWVMVMFGSALFAGALVVMKLFLPQEAAASSFTERDDDNERGSTMKSLKSRVVDLLAWVSTTQPKYKAIEKRGVVTASAAVLLAVTSGFLLVWLTTEDTYNSNAVVMLEFYRDGNCDTSLFSPRPYCALVVDPTTAHDCSARRLYVGCPQPLFVTAHLLSNATGGEVLVTSRVSAEDTSCAKMAPTAAAADACVPASLVVASSPKDETTHVSFRVGTMESVMKRFAQLVSIGNADASPAGSGANATLRPPPPQLIHTASSSDGDKKEQFPVARLRLRYARRLWSHQPFRYESVADPRRSIVGAANPQRLLIQVEDEAFVAPSAALLTTTRILEKENLGLQSGLPRNVTSLGPADGDYPLGFVYNYFGTAQSRSGKVAGPEASRYFNIISTPVDAGYITGASDASEIMGQGGFTVSFYMRADGSTLGFPFAVTDAYENLNTLHSPILDKMLDVMSNGCSQEFWGNFDYRLYYGLFVDGASKKIQFVSASRRAVVCVAWNPVLLGVDRLFNGAWHHVGLILRTENARIKIQLIVDGQTSLSQPGWNQCLPNFPSRIASLTDGSQGPVLATTGSTFDEVVYSGGSLITGYFNGGIGHLEFHNGRIDLFDLWRASTNAVRSRNALSRGPYLILGWTLVAIGIVSCLFTVLTTVRDLRREQQEQSDEARRACQALYRLLWAQQRHSSNGEQKNKATNAASYEGVSYQTVKRALRMDDEILYVLLEELLQNSGGSGASSAPPSAVAELARIVFWTCQGHVEKPTAVEEQPKEEEGEEEGAKRMPLRYPSAEEWSTLVSGLGPRGISSHPPETEADRQDEEKRALERSGGAQAIRTDTALRAQKTSDPGVDACAVSVLFVVQSVYMWMPSMSLPTAYLATFSAPFSIFSLDFFRIASLPSLGVPLILMLLCLSLLGFVFIALTVAESSFTLNVAHYAAKCVAAREGSVSLEAVTATAHCEAEEEEPKKYEKSCFSVEDSKRIKQLLKANRRGTKNRKKKEETASWTDPKPQSSSSPEDEDGIDPIAALDQAEPLSCFCAIHVKRRLAPQLQSSVWPYSHRPSCCVTIRGKRCDTALGRLYCCNHKACTRDGKTSSCMYAVCERHFQGNGMVNSLVLELLTSLRRVSTCGWTWACAVTALFVSQALFTPALRSAIMILACHPFFQCEFPTCWSNISQRYAAAAFLCGVLVAILGAAYPVWLFLMLRRRKRYLDEFLPSRRGGGEVTMSEWCLFADTDTSALASLYRHLQFGWMYLSPLLLAWKIALVCPVVLLETSSFSQLLGVCVAEMSFGVFIFSTNPFIAPVVNAVYKLGSVHQILFLGVLSLDTVSRFDSPHGSLAPCMTGLTGTYLALCVVLVAWNKILQILRRRRVHGHHVFERFALAPSSTEAQLIFAVRDVKRNLVLSPPTASIASHQPFDVEMSGGGDAVGSSPRDGD